MLISDNIKIIVYVYFVIITIFVVLPFSAILIFFIFI